MTSFESRWNLNPNSLHRWRKAIIVINAVYRLKYCQSRLSGIRRDALTGLVKENNLEYLKQSGGVEGIARALDSHIEGGIKGDARDLRLRRSMYGSNTYSPLKLLPAFLKETLKDITFLILLCAATLSLVLGIKRDGWKEGWYDGGALFVPLLLVAGVSLLKKFRHPKLIEKQSGLYGKIRVNVFRSGLKEEISILDVVVGDVVRLGIGDRVPADGLFIKGYTLELDLYPDIASESKEMVSIGMENPFLSAHSMVVGGEAHMLVAAVGLDTLRYEISGSEYRGSNEHKKSLLDKLEKLSSCIENIGAAITLLLLVVLSFRCFFTTKNTDDPDPNFGFYGGKTKMGETFEVARTLIMKQNLLMNKLLVIFSLFLALPPNMAVAVGFFFIYHWRSRMRPFGALVRHFSSVGTMARVSTIIINKECLLMPKQIVTEFSVGGEALVDDLSVVPRNIIQALWQGIGLSRTANVYKRYSVLRDEYFSSNSDSPTHEEAILSWAEQKLGMDMNELEETCNVLHVEAFDSRNKRSGLLIRKRVNRNEIFYVQWKGDARVILGMCSGHYARDGIEDLFETRMILNIESIIHDMENRGLQCIAFAHKKVERYNKKANSQELEKNGLTLLGLVGLKHLCRPEVARAVMTCRDAGIDTKIVTKDDISTATALAIECGVIHPYMDVDEAVITGSRLLEQSPTDREKMLKNVYIMARSSTYDEFLLVNCLKQSGHVVAVIQVGANHKPVLKEADLRVSMRSPDSIEVEESSDIILLDNNLTSLLAVLGWGQCCCNNIKLFIQLRVPVSILWLTINLFEAVSLVEVPVSALQLLWVDMFVGTIGAVALADKTPTKELDMDPTVRRWEPLITNIMWRNILAQALYQIAVMLTLQLKGEAIFNVEEDVKKALAFNTFFLCQVFNVFNARELEEKNVFTGIGQNHLFWWLMGSSVVVQEVMMQFGILETKRLNWVQCAACIGLAAVSLPVGCIAKSIPVPEEPHLGLLGLLSRAAKHIPVPSWARSILHTLHRTWINLKSPTDYLPVTKIV